MDPNDPIMIQQQQHAENLRRLQHAENQRRLDHQQLLEDEEREELQRGARAVTAGTDGEESKRRRWLFGAKRAAADKDGQPHEGSADVDSDDPREAPLEPSHTSSSGMSTVVWVGALLLAGLLVWVFGTRFMKGAEQPKPAVAQTRTDAGLPLAAPGDPLSVPGGPGLPDVAGAAVAVTAPIAVPTADPASDFAQAVSAPDTAASAAVGTEPAGIRTTDDATADASSADRAITGAEAAQLQERVSLLEVRLTNLQLELERLGEHNQSSGSQAHAAVPTPAAATPVRRAAKPRRSGVRTARSAPASPATVPPVAAVPLSAEQQLRNQMQAQLLSIDVWDGRPSVVVGTGVPGDKRVRVLQPGEQLHGVGLHSVDAAAGRATFSVGNGSLVTLDVKDAR